MALRPSASKTAEKAAPEAAAKTAAETADVENKQPEVQTDSEGNAINTGDANAAPNDLNRPVTPQAIEHDATEKQSAEAANALAAEQALAAAESEGRKPKKSDVQEHIYCKNLRPVSFRQPDTGKWIDGGGFAYLLDDGWLENHIKAGLIRKATKAEREQAE